MYRYVSEAPGVESEVAILEVDGDRIELLAPTNNTTSPIARFIKQKGKGVHHVAYRVDDLDVALEELKEQGIRTLEHTLRINKHGRRLIYLNPADTEGTIIEYCDYPKRNRRGIFLKVLRNNVIPFIYVFHIFFTNDSR